VMSDVRGNSRIGFVGGGNMTLAIAGGLRSSGFPADRIVISEPAAEQRLRLADALPGVRVVTDNAMLAATADCLVLATKPQVLGDVCRDLADTVQANRPLIISIAAGIRSRAITSWLGAELPVIRVMPNQPALLGLGASALCANAQASGLDRELATTVMRAVGKVVWVANEADIDAVTAISGSGPAYFYLLIDMLIDNAVALGLDTATARTLAVQTAVGAAALAADSALTMDELIASLQQPSWAPSARWYGSRTRPTSMRSRPSRAAGPPISIY